MIFMYILYSLTALINNGSTKISHKIHHRSPATPTSRHLRLCLRHGPAATAGPRRRRCRHRRALGTWEMLHLFGFFGESPKKGKNMVAFFGDFLAFFGKKSAFWMILDRFLPPVRWGSKETFCSVRFRGSRRLSYRYVQAHKGAPQAVWLITLV